jgi:DNA polymerase-3 subunit gamma/tau
VAYLSLYRKYRPQTFDEILGQRHVSETLANAIIEDRVAHAYLFTGPRGTGKTSTARILAKALNCENGPTPTPCGVCDACRAITEGSSLDVIEMDAASHSKVDETRDILAGVPLATAGGRKKVYVIDEVHMLSPGSFNALLKTLEEPPSHVLFILATTEAHKVLSTIVSRTQRFDFRRVPSTILEEHLADIAGREGYDIEKEAFGVVARHADGGVRDALSALDQLASISGRITAEDAEDLLGERHDDSFIELFDAIAAGDVGRVFVTSHSLVTQGADPRQLAFGALTHARSLLLLRTSPDAGMLLEVAADDLAALEAQSERISGPALLRMLDLLGKAITEMRNAPNHRLLLEVALVRAAAPETDPSPGGLLGRIERLERRMGISEQQAGEVVVQPVPATTPAPAATTPAPAATTPAATPAPESAPEQVSRKPAPKPAESPAEKQEPELVPQQEERPASPAPAQGVPAEVGFAAVKDSWGATLAEVGRRSKRIGGYLNPSRPLRMDDQGLLVEVQATFHESTMSEERNREVLAEALHSALGIRPALSFVARGSGPAEPSDTPHRPVPEPAAQAEDEVTDIEDTSPVEGGKHDPIELVKKGLGAEVVEERTPS